jgi:hypothetical protein
MLHFIKRKGIINYSYLVVVTCEVIRLIYLIKTTAPVMSIKQQLHNMTICFSP